MATPPPEKLAQGLGAFLNPGGVAQGASDADLAKILTWDYPMILDDGQGWLAPVGPAAPHGSAMHALVTDVAHWPRPMAVIPFFALKPYQLCLVNGPREHVTVVRYLTPGQWATLGLYTQWAAAGYPSSILCGQHDNTAGGPKWQAILATVLPIAGAIAGAAAGSPQAGAAAGNVAAGLLSTFENLQAQTGQSGAVAGYNPSAAPTAAAPAVQPTTLLALGALLYLLA